MEKRINYEAQAALLKALAHPLRLEIMHSLLRDGCRNVSCIEQHTGVSQSCISQHLQKLRAAGMVISERSGNEVYYRPAAWPEVARLVEVLVNGEEVPHVS